MNSFIIALNNYLLKIKSTNNQLQR